MAKVLTVGARKGGCGKTTSAINIAAQLGAEGRRVLLVDTDPQGTATFFAREDFKELPVGTSVFAAVLPEKFEDEAKPRALKTPWPKVKIWPSHPMLASASTELSKQGLINPDLRLSRALEEVGDRFDVIVIDVSPGIDRLSINSYAAADMVVSPFACDMASIAGLDHLIRNINEIRHHYNPDLGPVQLFGNMRRKTKHAKEAIRFIKETYPGQVLDTKIPLAVVIQHAQAEGVPLYQFDPDSKANKAFIDLTAEIKEKLNLDRKELANVA